MSSFALQVGLVKISVVGEDRIGRMWLSDGLLFDVLLNSSFQAAPYAEVDATRSEEHGGVPFCHGGGYQERPEQARRLRGERRVFVISALCLVSPLHTRQHPFPKPPPHLSVGVAVI